MSRYSRGDPNKPGFRKRRRVWFPSAERSAKLAREPWAPTPLNPNMVYKDGRIYMNAAVETIDEIVADASRYAEKHDVPDHVNALVWPSLMGALMKRFENNSGKHLLPGRSTEVVSHFAKAELGASTPRELIALLDEAPELEGVELAKISHPYEWHATREMDELVADAILGYGISPLEDDATPRYYFTRADNPNDPKSIVVIRKEPVGVLADTKNKVKIMKRNSYIVDLSHPLLQRDYGQVYEEFIEWLDIVKEDKNLRKAVQGGGKLRYDEPKLAAASETALEFDAHNEYLYPTTSSYYAYI